jgi:hypothetical protein
MENVTNFLEKVKLQQQADELLKAQINGLNTNESSVSHLINNKKHTYASGKLAEYRRLLKICKFKLVVYFINDKWGRPYTMQEIKEGKNKRPIPSVDVVRNVLNEEQGYNVLIDYCLKNQSNIQAGAIYLIDKKEGYEHTVFKFDARNIILSQNIEMEFITNEHGNRYYNRLLERPIRTDKIRNHD